MNIMEKTLTFGLIVGNRGFFNPRLAQEGRRHLLSKLDSLGYDYVIPSENATPNGAIESLEDAKKCAALFQENREKIDGIIIVLPNFGDEQGVVNTVNMAKLNVPVLVQGSDDDLNKLDINSRRDSFCGKLSVCNNLYQYDIRFTDTSLHTCPIDSDRFGKDIDYFARVCRVVKGLTSSRVGAIGTRPAAFQTVRFSEKILQASGITVVPIDLSEIIFKAQKIDDQAKGVKERLSQIKEYGKIPNYIKEKNILKQAKLSFVIDQWMEENELNASAIQCWTSIQENYGCAACLSMSLMGERFMPSACEVDIVGAISMYALVLASGNTSGFLDWNNNFGTDLDKCVCVHCSNYPKSFIGNEIEISDLDILGDKLGREKCFGAIKGQVGAGPLTFFRMSTDDPNGIIRAYVGEGDFTDDPCDINGGIAVCKIPNLRKLMGYLCQNGFEHHVAMTRGHCADVLYEAISKYLNWNCYYHK